MIGMSTQTGVVMVLLLASWLFDVVPVAAQTIHHVSPRSIERTVWPGDIVRAEVLVRNTYNRHIAVYPSVHTLAQAVATSGVETLVPGPIDHFRDWVTMTRAGQRLAPGEEVVVDVTFAIPRSVDSGVYHGLLGFGQGPSRDLAVRAVNEGVAPAVVLRFTVPEREYSSDGAVAIEVTPLIFDSRQTAVRYTIHNPGDVPIIPTGEILMLNQRGAEVASIPVNEINKAIAPGEMLSMSTTTPAVLSRLGTYTTRARIDFQHDKLAAVSMVDSFWYVPWQWLVGLVLLVLTISVWLYRHLAKRLNPARPDGDGIVQVPLHLYQGESPPEEHDLNLKQ